MRPNTTPSPSPATTSGRPVPRRPRSWRSRWGTGSSTWSGESPGAWTSIRFAPRLSFFFDVHNDFFEEVAKFRAARRIWARHMREKYGATNPDSWRLRTHAQTAGVSLTAQQPENNIVRVAYQALAAVLGGTQSLHTNSMDETLALPTEKAVRIALRTQQILAYETGVPNTMDPLAGSYYLEALTNQLEAEAEEIFRQVEEIGGVVPGIETGWFQKGIADSAFRQQTEVESGRRKVVGVNDFTEGSGTIEIDTLSISPEIEEKQRATDGPPPEPSGTTSGSGTPWPPWRSAAGGDANLVDPILECARAYCTLYRDPGGHGEGLRELQGARVLLEPQIHVHQRDLLRCRKHAHLRRSQGWFSPSSGNTGPRLTRNGSGSAEFQARTSLVRRVEEGAFGTENHIWQEYFGTSSGSPGFRRTASSRSGSGSGRSTSSTTSGRYMDPRHRPGPGPICRGRVPDGRHLQRRRAGGGAHRRSRDPGSVRVRDGLRARGSGKAGPGDLPSGLQADGG